MTVSFSPSNGAPRGVGGSLLTKYFLMILFCFALMSFMLNIHFTHNVQHNGNVIESFLTASSQSMVKKPLNVSPDESNVVPVDSPKVDEESPDLDSEREKEESKGGGVEPQSDIIKHVGLENPHSSRISGLNCDKYSGPSVQAAQEMVYWEDIPSDSEWISPFHSKHRNGPPQYLTFEPDLGGWNNIR